MINSRKPIFLLIMVLMLMMVVLPVIAQDAPTFEITGEITFVDGDVFVDGVAIAPGGAFLPSDYEAGDYVTVIGTLTEDDTLLVISIEDAIKSADDAEEQGQGNNSNNGKGNSGNNGQGDDDDDAEEQDRGNNGNNGVGNNSNNGQGNNDAGDNADNDTDDADADEEATHPIAEILAEEFGMDVEEIIELAEEMSYGNIARALSMNAQFEALGIEGVDVFADFEEYGNWGQLMQAYTEEYNIKPGDLAPGRAISNSKSNRPEDAGEQGQGQDNGQGNDS
jgi:hypothetical protein